MADTSARLLRLLSLLHSRQGLGGAELAARLEVAPRTLRRDIERLRAQGYPVEADQGASGYRLGSGAHVPPLILNDEEAVAVVLGLRGAAQQTVTGVADASIEALAKLEQVLPARLRHRVKTLASATEYAGIPEGTPVEMEVLMTTAQACRRGERLRFDYARPGADTTRREVEPYRVLCFNRKWYLVAFDLEKDDWRTFRLDRLTPRIPFGVRFREREIPFGGAAQYLERQLSSQAWAVRAVFRVFAPATEVESQVWPGMGSVEPETDGTCLLYLGAPRVPELRWMVTSLDVDFEVVSGPDELTTALRREGMRCLQAVGRA